MAHLDLFTEYLQNEFHARRAKNSSYSLRAFSRLLEVDQSLLTKVLKQKKTFSPKVMFKCLENLKSPPEIKAKFRREVEKVQGTYTEVNEATLSVLSDWKYWAIIEFLKISPAADKKLIAKKFNISLKAIPTYLKNLETLGFILKTDEEYILLRPNNDWVATERTSAARKKMQSDLLQLSLKALQKISPESRLHTSFTVAIDKKKLPALKKKLSQIQFEFGDHAQKGTNLNEVYQLTMSFFPLTKTD